VKAEAAFAREVRPLLLVAVDVVQVRVEVDHSLLTLLDAIAPSPGVLLDLVDGAVERSDRTLVEAPQEVAGRRRIRDPGRTQQATHRLAVLQIGDVLDRRATREEVVHVGQYVVRLVKWAPRPQQRELSVDRLRHPQPSGQANCQSKTTQSRRLARLDAHLQLRLTELPLSRTR
jgi:hypothetical protein